MMTSWKIPSPIYKSMNIVPHLSSGDLSLASALAVDRLAELRELVRLLADRGTGVFMNGSGVAAVPGLFSFAESTVSKNDDNLVRFSSQYFRAMSVYVWTPLIANANNCSIYA